MCLTKSCVGSKEDSDQLCWRMEKSE